VAKPIHKTEKGKPIFLQNQISACSKSNRPTSLPTHGQSYAETTTNKNTKQITHTRARAQTWKSSYEEILNRL